MIRRFRSVVLLVALCTLPACAPRVTLVEGFGTEGRTLRVVNRDATRIPDRHGVRLSPAHGNGVAWVEGTEFRSGTIEVDVRGREEASQHYVGVAFHRSDDGTYEAAYVRPFNFRAADPLRKQHAVQYISLPDNDWPDLRKSSPEEFENPVDSSLDPNDWVRLRVVVTGDKIQIYVGALQASTLDVRKLGKLDGGQVGLWVGNDSGGDFANLAITAATGVRRTRLGLGDQRVGIAMMRTPDGPRPLSATSASCSPSTTSTRRSTGSCRRAWGCHEAR